MAGRDCVLPAPPPGGTRLRRGFRFDGGTQAPASRSEPWPSPLPPTLSTLQPFSLRPIPLKLVSSPLCHPSASCFCTSSLRPADHCTNPGVLSASGSPASWDAWSGGRGETHTQASTAVHSGPPRGPAGRPDEGSGLGLKGSPSPSAGRPCLWPEPRAPIFLLCAFLQASPEPWAASCSPLALDGLQPQQPLSCLRAVSGPPGSPELSHPCPPET